MTYIHQPYYPGETIAAIATPPGEGGVAIIRISGDDALAVGAKLLPALFTLMPRILSTMAKSSIIKDKSSMMFCF